MEQVVVNFWDRWYQADELERVRLVETLTLPSRELEGDLYKHHCATLLNSYLVNAVDAERKRIAQLLHDKGQPWIDQNLVYTTEDKILEALE